MLPERFAIGCSERGWVIRNMIIWSKKNSMPESVKSRFSKKYEHFIFLTKIPSGYYFDLDAIREPYKENTVKRDGMGRSERNKWKDGANGQRPHSFHQAKENGSIKSTLHDLGKNPGDVWHISTKPSRKGHFASYNKELIDKPIKAGCPPGGIIYDPFAGTGTTLVRAYELSRQYIGSEGNPDYIKISHKAINGAQKELLLK